MSIGFRHADHRYPFLWETAAQPPGRWHADGEGPCQYLADTPTGPGPSSSGTKITDPADLAGITRSLWAIDVPDSVLADSRRAAAPDMTGGPESYPACQDYARAQRSRGVTDLIAPSAALLPGAAGGQVTDNGLRDAENRDGATWVRARAGPAWVARRGPRPSTGPRPRPHPAPALTMGRRRRRGVNRSVPGRGIAHREPKGPDTSGPAHVRPCEPDNRPERDSRRRPHGLTRLRWTRCPPTHRMRCSRCRWGWRC